MKEALEKRFHEDMIELYKEIRKVSDAPKIFLDMVVMEGGVNAAKELIKNETKRFKRLKDIGRLDLTVEAYVVKEIYRELFIDERKVCVKRLTEAGYAVK